MTTMGTMTYNKAGLSRMNSHETHSEKIFDVRSYTATPSTGAHGFRIPPAQTIAASAQPAASSMAGRSVTLPPSRSILMSMFTSTNRASVPGLRTL